MPLFAKFQHKISRTAILTLGLAVLVLAFPVEIVRAQSAVVSAIEGVLLTFVNVVFGWLVWVGGQLLDYAVNEMVIGFGELYIGSGIGFTIDRLWVMVRDIFNLTFIFGLVFIGLKMIFDSANSNTRRMLISLIIAALLVNFSLLITKLVVDFSNIAAEQLVNTFPPDASGNRQVAGSFMNIMGLQELWDVGRNIDGFENFRGGAGLGYIIGSMFLYIISAFVFLSGALLLMIRFVALNLYMLLSPLMFLGMVFPAAADITRQYWTGFISRAFFAPIYILLLYFAHEILSTFAITKSGSTLSKVFGEGGPDSFAKVVPPFVLTAIFMIAAIVVAQKMSNEGAGAAISLQNSLKNRVMNGVRRSAFTSANLAARPVTVPARNKVNAIGKGGLKTFEKWQAAGQAPNAGWLSKQRSKLMSTNTADRAARAAAGTLKQVQFGTGTTSEKEEEYQRKVQSGINQNLAEGERDKKFTESFTTLTDNMKLASKTEDELKTALNDLGKTIRDMSKAEKEGLKLEQLTNRNVAYHLSDSDIDGIEKSGKFSAQEIQNIKDARKKAYVAVATGGSTLAAETKDSTTGKSTFSPFTLTSKDASGATIAKAVTVQREELVNRSVKDVGKMPVEIFTSAEMRPYITPQMVEERLRNGGVSNSDQELIRRNIQDYLDSGTAEAPKVAAWKKWVDSSTYGSGFGLTITNAPEPVSGPRVPFKQKLRERGDVS